MDRQITRHEDRSSSWPCQAKKCKKTVWCYRHQSTTQCDCGAQYNCFGQRLTNNWRDNPSNYDSDIGDMEGYEMSQGDY